MWETHIQYHDLRISIKPLTGQKIQLDVREDDTIEQVKSKIQGIPWDQQKLMFGDKRLDEGLVYDHDIRNGSTLDIVSRAMKIFIETPSGKTLTLEVPDSTTIEEASRALIIEGITIVLPGMVRRVQLDLL